jgi:hypothetical protein
MRDIAKKNSYEKTGRFSQRVKKAKPALESCR